MRLYISSFEDNGTKQYGLYIDNNGKQETYTENWKPVVFDNETDAQAKLAELEAERKREDAAEPFSLEEAKRFAESYNWKFASTYAKTAPHEYLIKKWLDKDERLQYERFVATMKKQSVVGYFYGHKNDYFILGDYYYWFMPLPDNLAVDLINRTTTNYLEYRDGAYYYKLDKGI